VWEFGQMNINLFRSYWIMYRISHKLSLYSVNILIFFVYTELRTWGVCVPYKSQTRLVLGHKIQVISSVPTWANVLYLSMTQHDLHVVSTLWTSIELLLESNLPFTLYIYLTTQEKRYALLILKHKHLILN